VSLTDRQLAEVFERSRDTLPQLRIMKSTDVAPGRLWDRHPVSRYWTHGVSVAAQALATKLLAWLDGWSDVPRSTGGTAAFTVYPLWWSAPFTSAASDRFFSHLADIGVAGYLAWFGSPTLLWRHRREVRQIVRARGLLPLQAFLKVVEPLSLLRFSRFRPVWRYERHLRSHVRATFARFDVGPLMADEVSRSLTAGEPFQNSLISRAVRRASGALRPETVLFRLEFQPTESALLRGLGGTAAGIGYLHYPFARNYLSMRFAPGEIDRYLGCQDSPRERPLPSAVIASGEAGLQHLADSGYPRTRMAVCGPQRYGRLAEYLRGRPDPRAVRATLGLPAGVRVFFVALAIKEEDTEALFGALAEAAAIAGDFRLVVRTHPNRPRGDDALAVALTALGASRASLMDPTQDVYDYLVAVDAMICIGSMIAFEAMALGTMPIVFENPGSHAALSLAEYEAGLFVVRNGQELAAALGAVGHDGPAARRKRAHWPVVLQQVLGDLETPLPKQLLAALDQIGQSAA
jgi:hypothetical protein